METYCISYKNSYTTNANSNVRKTRQNRLMLLSNCVIYGKKKATFIKSQELDSFVDWRQMHPRIAWIYLYCSLTIY